MTNSRCKFPMLDMRFYLLPDTRTAGSHLRHWKSGTLLILWKLQIEDILLAASLFVNGTFSTMGILQFCEAGSACGLFGWRYHKCIGGIFIQTWPYGLFGWRYHQTQFRNPYLCNHLFTTFFFFYLLLHGQIFSMLPLGQQFSMLPLGQKFAMLPHGQDFGRDILFRFWSFPSDG